MSEEAARRFTDLPPTVQTMLVSLKKEEVDSLEYLATIPKDELRGMMKFIRDARAIGWFSKVVFFGIVGAFIGVVTLGESIMKMIGWIRSP